MITRTQLDISRIARTLGRNLLLLVVYDIAVTAAYLAGWTWVAIPELPLPLLGSAIAIIVTFRNNAAYNRWWEARTLWGQVVNSSRSFARGLISFLDDPAMRAVLVRLQIAYAAALRCSLLGTTPDATVTANVPPDTMARLSAHANLPTALQNAIAGTLADARRAGRIDTIAVTGMEQILTDLANAQGGLERIRKTPLPRQYVHFPQIFIAIYCLLLPLGLVHDMGLLTPIGSTIVGLMFLSLDRIGRDLENPFEGTVHDVPMQAITRTIEIELMQSIGTADVPDRVTERDGVLW